MITIDNLTSLEEKLCTIANINKHPIGGTLELLPLCNMNCDMCYVRLSPEEVKRKGRILSGDEWLSLASQMRDSGTLFLLLTGGEPLLHPDFKEIYLGLHQMGMILTLNTNGILITEELASFFGQYRPRRINVTLYGGCDNTYKNLCHHPAGFEQTLTGIKLLLKHNVDVKLNGSLVQANQQDLNAILQMAEELGLFLKVDTYMYPASRERENSFCNSSRLPAKEAARYEIAIQKKQLTPEEFQAYREELLSRISAPDTIEELPNPCRAGRSSFLINWQGRMQPCTVLTSPAINVSEHGFSASWEYLTDKMEQLRLSPKCAACELQKVCQPCAGCAVSETGSITGTPDYMCEYTKERLRLLSHPES